MKILKKEKPGNKKLILFFNGWSVNPEVFNHLQFAEDFDLWIAYDYRDLYFSEKLSQFIEIHLIAWSFGVWIANKIFSKVTPNFTSATAINGSFLPINDEFGIPEKIFDGTLQNFNLQNFIKFNRRICGTKEIWQNYQKFVLRDENEVFVELKNIFNEVKNGEFFEKIFWKSAIIAKNDAIFPAENLQRFWNKKCEVKQLDSAHFLFFSWQNWSEIWM